jgi:hypothetical protein
MAEKKTPVRKPEKVEKTRFQVLSDSTDHVSEDELAERIKQHQDRDILFAVWRAARGDVAPVRDDDSDDDEEEDDE